jgi:glycosyltransferase involved in cell wall biosynthesis
VVDNGVEISVVIPICDDGSHLINIIDTLQNQTFLPKEIVIIDSSTNDGAKTIIEQYADTVPINYHYEKRAYPGKARNIGAELAQSEWIAFLDSKTLPKRDWLERYKHLVQAYQADVVFGITQFEATTPFQQALRAATYGKIGHHTVPGTLIKKKAFSDFNGFLEHVRMGEDIEWRERLISKDLNIYVPEEPVVTYYGLPNTFIKTFSKYVKSAYHTARLNILKNIKDGYLSLLLILSAIIIPKWNHLIGGWETNPLFIPHVTKIYLLALVSILLIYLLVNYLFFRNLSKTLFSHTLKVIVLVFITIAVYRWNAVIAGWVEDAVLYIPHITKIYIAGIIITSVLYRGLFQPLYREVDVGFLFPLRWIKVGLLGLSLDIFKAPGYIVGSILEFIRLESLIKSKQNGTFYRKKKKNS